MLKLYNPIKSTKCVLPIFIGLKYYEKEQLGKTIELINNKYNTLDIVVCDTLQRWTYINRPDMPGCAYQTALLAGSNWIYRNDQYIKQLTIPYRVTRWQHWLDQVDIDSALQVYTSNKNFIDAIKQSLDLESNDNKIFKMHYLFEKCVVIDMFKKYNACVLYPPKPFLFY